MNKTQPIRDEKIVKEIGERLRTGNIRNYIMYRLGAYNGLPLSKILTLKVSDFRGKESIQIIAKRCGVILDYEIDQETRDVIERYIVGMADNEYLINAKNGTGKPMTKYQAYRILSAAGIRYGIDDLGSHVMQKTFGYFHYKEYGSTEVLQALYDIPSNLQVLVYIGEMTKQEAIDEIMGSVSYQREPIV